MVPCNRLFEASFCRKFFVAHDRQYSRFQLAALFSDRSGTLSEQEFLAFAQRPDVAPHIYKLEAHLCPPTGVRLVKYLDGRGGHRDGQISFQEFSGLLQMISWPYAQAQAAWYQSEYVL